MKKHIRTAGAACLLVMMCLHPAQTLNAARQSLTVWAQSVAPALLPYLIICPALTCPETTAFLARFTGGLLRAVRLPASAGGAILIGLFSGSPAGAAALAASQRDLSAPRGAVLRAALLASGASPAFLLTGVAVSLLNQPETGWILLKSQLISLWTTALLLRNFGSEQQVSAPPRRRSEGSSILSACRTLLIIGGTMTLFSVIARLLSLLLGSAWETPLLAVMELAGGCGALAALPVPIGYRLPLISAAACFGGVSVYAQCMSFLRPLGVNPVEYAAGKLVQSALCALFTFVQMEMPKWSIDPALTGFFLLCCLLLTLLIHILLKRRAAQTGSRA